MSCFACASVSLRGSVSCAVICRYLSSCLIVASSATAIAEHVAPFVAHANLEHRHAVRRLVERVEVAGDVLVVRHVPRLSGDVAEELERRWHLVGRRHVIDELGQDARIGRCRLDLRGVVGVDFLRGGRRRFRLREDSRRADPRREQRQRGRDRQSGAHARPAYRNTHSPSSRAPLQVLQTGVDARTARKIPWIQEQSAAPWPSWLPRQQRPSSCTRRVVMNMIYNIV